MRLSMDSYKPDGYYYTVIGKARTKKVNVRRANLESVIKLLNTFIPKNRYQIVFLKRLRHAVSQIISKPKVARDVSTVGPFVIDEFLELDSLGIEKNSNTYTVFVSTCDCLDLALNKICGVDIEKVRSIKNYKLISRALTSGDCDLMSDMSFESLVNIDEKLDEYLISHYLASETKYDFIRTLLTAITNVTQTILDDTMSRFRTYYNQLHPDGIVLRAQSSSKLIMGSEEPFEYELKVADDYYIKFKTYERFEFINHVQDTCCIYEGGVGNDPLWND